MALYQLENPFLIDAGTERNIAATLDSWKA
jgi:hypothetical protein